MRIVWTAGWVEPGGKWMMVTIIHSSSAPNHLVGTRTNVTRTRIYPDTCLTQTRVLPGHVSAWTKMPEQVSPGHVLPRQR